MTEKTDEVIHRFFSSICEEEVVITDLEEVENFRIGTKLYSLNSYELIIVDVVNHLIKDTSIPKTYRKIFERYLKWASALEGN